jgi:pimeloyl-ACP methyl ester carboxylesterase
MGRQMIMNITLLPSTPKLRSVLALAASIVSTTSIAESSILRPRITTADAGTVSAQTSGRAVVVIEGGGIPHAYTTPWAACDGGRDQYIQALVDAGLPVFTAPGFGNLYSNTFGRTGCPPQPPLEVQWNTAGYPTQAGQAVLGLLGYLHETYGYKTFDLVGYSYGGIVARATVAAIKQRPPAGSAAPAFSYQQIVVDAGVSIPSIVTINSPHLGAPSYDIASDPAAYTRKVARSWGRQYAETNKGLIVFEKTANAGAIQVLKTSGHAKNDPKSWDAQQVGVLDDVKLTLMAGDYCGRRCDPVRTDPMINANRFPRTDAVVPVYSQLMLPCPTPCPAPPGSVDLPPNMVPEATVVRKTFPTVHSTFDTDRLNLPQELSVTKNPAAIEYLVNTVLTRWKEAGVSPLTPP